MSAATPAPSSSGGVSPTNASAPDVTQGINSIDRLVLEYLRSRGHKDAERALQESIESGVDESVKTISTEELIKNLAVYAQKPSRPGDNVLKESANVLQELTTMGNPPSIQNLIASLGTVGAEEILSVDPTDKEEGFRELEAWVEGSLDMYKVLREYNITCRNGLIRAIARISTYFVSHILPFPPGSCAARIQGSWYVGGILYYIRLTHFCFFQLGAFTTRIRRL